MQLTKDQQRIFDKIESTSDCILVQGKPGVGKSVLINHLRNAGQKHYDVAAPTGLAALNINGKTLHSLFGIAPSQGVYVPTYNNFTKNENVLRHLKYTVKHVIIDEVSMVRCDMLDFIDRLLQTVKENKLPFGGVQVICFGDFFQLPPIASPLEKRDLREQGYASEFAFDAHVFKHFTTLSLNEVLRQADPIFLDILHSMRLGKLSAKQLALLNEHVGTYDDVRIKLCATNAQSKKINDYELDQLKTPKYTYSAMINGNWPQLPVDEYLTLREGAQVLVKKNYKDKPLVNGSLKLCGEVTPDYVDIDGYEIKRETWDQKEKRFLDGKWIEQFKGSYTQIPLQLAWAISMHKSQGQTFEKAHISPTNIFADGQLYVAISRLKTLAGLSLHEPIQNKHITTSKHVLKWSKTIE